MLKQLVRFSDFTSAVFSDFSLESTCCRPRSISSHMFAPAARQATQTPAEAYWECTVKPSHTVPLGPSGCMPWPVRLHALARPVAFLGPSAPLLACPLTPPRRCPARKLARKLSRTLAARSLDRALAWPTCALAGAWPAGPHSEPTSRSLGLPACAPARSRPPPAPRPDARQ